MFCVLILFMTFRFLSTRKNGTEQILARMELSDLKIASAIDTQTEILKSLVRIVEKMGDRQEAMSTNIQEIKHGSTISR